MVCFKIIDYITAGCVLLTYKRAVHTGRLTCLYAITQICVGNIMDGTNT